MMRPWIPPSALQVFGAIIALLMIASCQREVQGIPSDSGDVIDKYLVGRIGATSEAGAVFCDFEPLAPMIQRGSSYDVYLWALCQEYFIRDGGLQEGTGSSLPIALTLEQRGSGCVVKQGRIPGEVAQSQELVREYFPEPAWAGIEPRTDEEVEAYNARVQRLVSQVEAEAMADLLKPAQ